jgi:hypothetical protein
MVLKGTTLYYFKTKKVRVPAPLFTAPLLFAFFCLQKFFFFFFFFLLA